jgi:uncharacterized membrane protein YidH (DUF202 family)
MKSENLEHLEAIQDIRLMMKKSTRFLSLSGLSGVCAGIFALAGSGIAYIYFQNILKTYTTANGQSLIPVSETDIVLNFILIAFGVLALSIITAFYFSNRKAKRMGQKLFDHSGIRVLINLSIPLIAGGIFCLALLYYNAVAFIGPVMLLFYGMALINASKYTYDDIRYLGLCEIILGLVNAFNIGHSLLYWAIGFGVLHIVYGTVMWFKYERKV